MLGIRQHAGLDIEGFVYWYDADEDASGDGINTPATATETVTAAAAAALTITKSITPAQVVDNDRVTYTFVIQNTGNKAVLATDNAAITDTFDPILTNLVVTYNGTAYNRNSESYRW